MEIKIRHIKNNNLSWEKIIQSDKGDYLLAERIFHTILRHFFLHKKTTLLTIQPQKYSLGYELAQYKEFKVNKKNILINEVSDCGDELLKDIAQSEEFKRTLLIMIYNVSEVGTTLISDIMSLVSSPSYSSSSLHSTMFAYCEDDGDSLYLYNSSLTLNGLETLISELL
ncbi:hypothetical protein [Chitinophaga japonensis]|uniref:Uncharacterized protein n=1 Tax=Chitinophaga japonensis TaxID=104662 RepID=A0A562SZ80_CHIJA|nr:hypothetical protein [Chitinophaga japonensis]TWI86591.1 hypothetical protein LX66_3850 [Chitinophaga japonensis]